MDHKTPAPGNPLGEAPINKLLIQFAIPSIVSTLIGSLYNMVDQMFIGQRIGYLGRVRFRKPLCNLQGNIFLCERIFLRD